MRRRSELTLASRRVLRHFATHRDALPLPLVAVAKRLGVNRSTVLYHARWLVLAGYLFPDSRSYRASASGIDAAAETPPKSPNGKAAPKR